MNPILKSRRNIILYGSCVLLYAVVYAVLFAAAFPVGQGFVWIDGLMVWAVAVVEGIVVWNALRYAVPDRMSVRRFAAVVSGVVVVGSITGMETLAAYTSQPQDFGRFVRGIPLRIFCTSLAYTVLAVWYRVRSAEESTTCSPVVSGKAPPVKSEPMGRVTVRAGGRVKVIDVDEIDYIAADGDYVAITTCEGRWLKEQTMKYFEENLPAGDFVRIHRSYLVALRRIVRIERYGKLYQVTFRSGEKLRMSAGGYKLLKEKLNL